MFGEPGVPINFTASAPGYTITKYWFYFGDGQAINSTSATVSHTFHSAGTFYVYVFLVDSTGRLHDNDHDLLPFSVFNSFEGDILGNLVETSGSVISNSTSGVNATPILQAGQTITVSAWISGNVTTPSTAVGPSGFPIRYEIAGAGNQNLFIIKVVSGNGWSSATPLVASITSTSSISPGSYTANFTVPTLLMTPSGATWANSTYSFTIIIAWLNQYAPPYVPPVMTDKHPGTLQVYEEIPGGSASEDPSADYETAGYEVIYNVYQTLINYNGSQAGPNPGSYVPNLATCVPGSAQCTALYGNPLTDGYNFTFVLNPNARFYNPYTTPASSYPVEPYDVVYSIVRTCLWSGNDVTPPFYQSNPGWIVCQALLPNAYVNTVNNAPNPTYDSGLHFPLNNTPAELMQAMTINQTGVCPETGGHFDGAGCVTFHTFAQTGVSWPYFLELITDNLGSSVQSCKFGVSMGGVALQGWLAGGNPNDCANVPQNQTVVHGIGMPSGPYPANTAWDSYIPLGASTNWPLYMRWHMVGSGPYYLQNIQVGQSYSLQQNPVWTGTDCQGGLALGCLPTAAQIQAHTVDVVWEPTQDAGEAAYQAGTADFATVPSTDTSLLLSLESQGLIGAYTEPTMNVFFNAFDMAYAVGLAQPYTTTNLTAPSWIFQDLNLREFLTHAYDYATTQAQECTVDGIQYCVQYGGAIPHFMGNFYPTNISWPAGEVNSNKSDPSSAAWWWAQTAADSMAGAVCKPTSPCTIPFFSYSGDPFDDAINALYISSITTISDGAIVPVKIDIPFIQLVINSFSASGSDPMAMYVLGWSPDYPDPSDYVGPFYQPTGTYTVGEAWWDAMSLAPSQAGSLAHSAWSTSSGYTAACPGSSPDGFSLTSVNTACQGSAYRNMSTLLSLGNTCAPPTCSASQRALYYNMAENIGNDLSLMVYRNQQVGVGTYATWISTASFHPNPMLPSIWYNVQYVS